ncbi:MAG TPA: AAA family ATPase [Candidatus Binatia bacterium]|nr:AAA family ATPase [Candidatus Binatia bacterium]
MYTAFFGFNDKPFSVTPDAQFFYTNATYEEAYANLLYGIRERKGFMMLTGEVGTGKTTILRRLMEELDASVPFAFFYNTTLTFAELLAFICEELDLKADGNGQLAKIQALNKFLINQLEKGSTAVLFVDEAQNLREDVFENLRLLSNLETSREKLLQIILAGQPELELKLRQPELRQLKQRMFSHSRLGPLNEEQVGAFIEYRLKAVGQARNDLFPRDTVREIANYSRGIPRLVNIICDNALLIAYAGSKKKVSSEIIREVARDLQLAGASRTPENPTKVNRLSLFRKRPEERHSIEANGKRQSSGHAPPSQTEQDPDHGTINQPASMKSETQIVTQCLATLTSELTEAMGPMAPIVVRNHLTAVLDSSEMLPKTSFEKLVELVSAEILNDALRAGFQKKMSALAGGLEADKAP